LGLPRVFAPGVAGEFSPPSESGADSFRPQPEKETAALSRIPSQRIRTRCEERFMIFGQRNLTVRVASRQFHNP